MTVFRILSGLAIVLLCVAIAYDFRRLGKSWKGIGQILRGQANDAVGAWSRRKIAGRVSALENLRRIIYGISVMLFGLLALTGFAPVLILGDHLSGVLLIIHVTVAPLFALFLSALALLWAHRLGFDQGDWQCLVALWNRQSLQKEMLARFGQKLAFWLVLLLSLPLMMTVIVSLFPLFGTEGEELLIRGHGYSALLLLLVALAEIHLTLAYVHQTKEVVP